MDHYRAIIGAAEELANLKATLRGLLDTAEVEPECDAS